MIDKSTVKMLHGEAEANRSGLATEVRVEIKDTQQLHRHQGHGALHDRQKVVDTDTLKKK